MIGLALTSALLNGLLTAASAPAAEDPIVALERHQQKLFEQIAPAVVFISTGEAFGSGFFVTSDGLALTNAHVVKGKSKVDVVLHDGRRVVGAVAEKASDDVDLALVQLPVQGVPALPLTGLSAIRVGSWVGAVGHGRGAIWTFNTGMVSNIYPDGAERPVFQTQIPLNPGNSGGPIFDRQGNVVGVVTAGIADASAINFGIGIDIALRSLTKLSKVCDFLVVNAPKGVPVFVNGAMVGTGPRVAVPAVRGKEYEAFAVVNGAMKRGRARFPEVREIELK